ncbi:MAG: glycosyltransferase [Bradymonadaceae bacterium]
MKIAFFGSSLVSAYWNGAATYYRGLIRALADRGHSIRFFEPDVYDRQAHRDIPDPSWAEVIVYEADESEAARALARASTADLVVKTSGVGALDRFLNRSVLAAQDTVTDVVYWDVDAPATLERMTDNPDDPFRDLVPRYDAIFTYGGGPPVVDGYAEFGAAACHPIYNALDPRTHHPVDPVERFEADLSFLGNRLPDREQRVEEFFFEPAGRMADRRCLLGGSGWADKPRPDNVDFVGHVYTDDHNAFNCSAEAVLNINRQSMADYGYSPPTRIFEAAGAGACLISDDWKGIETFLEPGREVLLAEDGDEVVRIVRELTPERAAEIGRRARARLIDEHTYEHRAAQLEAILRGGDR